MAASTCACVIPSGTIAAALLGNASLTVLLINNGEPRYQATGALKEMATTKIHQNRLRIVQPSCQTEHIQLLASLLYTG